MRRSFAAVPFGDALGLGARHAFPPSGTSYFWRTRATWLLEALLLSDAPGGLWRNEPLVAPSGYALRWRTCVAGERLLEGESHFVQGGAVPLGCAWVCAKNAGSTEGRA
ncbi:hypothetical protein NYE70_18355 [Paenibacillus sp. FSL R5-0407]|uniref:hypothetical protein n=1 Tax=Paenibacillus sp. FSL R5-0407 TaxID=2975320 RepID=UPI0030F98EA5